MILVTKKMVSDRFKINIKKRKERKKGCVSAKHKLEELTAISPIVRFYVVGNLISTKFSNNSHVSCQIEKYLHNK
jgi:hypothetical protein